MGSDPAVSGVMAAGRRTGRDLASERASLRRRDSKGHRREMKGRRLEAGEEMESSTIIGGQR